MDPSPPPPERILEALLFVGGEPVTAAQVCEAVRGLTPEDVGQLVAHLNGTYRTQNRPYRIQARGEGYRLALLPRHRGVLQRLYGSNREARLSQAALDVLALVAYRQPATREDVENQRGADSAGPLRQLVRLGLIAPERAGGAGETVYHTTPRFLSLFGLRCLEDLPAVAPLPGEQEPR